MLWQWCKLGYKSSILDIESTCPPAIRQLPEQTLHLYDVESDIWLRKISPKEDSKVFKLQFWKLFVLNDWFKILTNNVFSHKDCINGCMWLNAHKKCLPLNSDLEPSFLAQWLGDNSSLTTQLVSKCWCIKVEQWIEWLGIFKTSWITSTPQYNRY